MEPPSPWKRPNEVMQLHRLKRRKQALQKRMKQPLGSTTPDTTVVNTDIDINFSRILDGDKRKNPFSKNNSQKNKKQKLNESTELDESNDKTLFALLNLPSKAPEKPAQNVETDKLSTFSSLLQKYTAEHTIVPISESRYKHLPIDWAVKTKLRLMSPKPFAWNQQLKASEEAAGITGFVRCIEASSVDAPRARFHQSCLYWQHPSLPWLQLFPRSSGKVAATGVLAAHEDIKQALHKDWTESFRSLFQLLRARHCPYFYVCANTFTCLFRAAGLCGLDEPCALIAPTTRGFRQSLRQEDVEFTMPLRPDKKKLNNSDSKDDDKPKNSSFDSCYDTMDEARSPHESQNIDRNKHDDVSDDEEDLDDNFLSKLGLETDIIKKINNTQARIANQTESSVDSAAESLVCVKGADAQALFNFLLNCKSVVAPTGPLASVPPTLLAPIAFHGATLNSLKVKESTITVDNSKYYSIELRGPILPTTLHTLFQLLRDTAAARVSATFAHHAPSLAFSWAAKPIAEGETSKENEPKQFAKAFNKENLSDCGIGKEMLQLFCSPDPNIVKVVDNITYNVDDGTYTW